MNLRDQTEEIVDSMLDGQILLKEALREFERIYIERCLKRNNGRISDAAIVLGVHRNTVSKKIAIYNQQDRASRTNSEQFRATH